jgi:hypothetical protein
VREVTGHLLRPSDDLCRHMAPLDLIPPVLGESSGRIGNVSGSRRGSTSYGNGYKRWRGQGNPFRRQSFSNHGQTMRISQGTDDACLDMAKSDADNSGPCSLPPLDMAFSGMVFDGPSPGVQSQNSDYRCSISSGDVEFELSDNTCAQARFA